MDSQSADAWTVFKQSMNISSFIAGSIAGASGVLVGHPFDSLKVRMQVGQNYQVKQWNADVIRQLYRGISPPLVSVGGIAAINFALYESFKSFLRKRQTENTNRVPLSHIFYAGCFSGAIISTFTSPVGVVKVQLQIAKHLGFRQCVHDMFATYGIRSFYRGSLLTFLMESPGRGLYLWTYEAVKSLCLNPYEWPTRIVNPRDDFPIYLRALSASTAGIVCWFVIYPFDVIKSRLQLDIARSKYSSVWHCVRCTWQEGGFRAFYRGLSYTILRAGPVAATILPIYDVTKAYLDHHLHPEEHLDITSSARILNRNDEEESCTATTISR